MMSGAAIRDESRRAAERAADEGKKPFVPEPEDFEVYRASGKGVKIPNLGDYVPKGWERLPRDDWWFVDKSGFDRSGPALSIGAFINALEAYNREHPTHGVAMVEEGQFQCYVAPFAPKARRKSRATD